MDIEEKIIQKLLNNGACDKFKDSIDKDKPLESLLEWAMSRTGYWFILKHGIPTIEDWRELKARGGYPSYLHIDEGKINIDGDTEKAIIVGDTCATISCCSVEPHIISCYCGGKVNLNANGFAIVCVNAKKEELKANKSYNAVIL